MSRFFMRMLSIALTLTCLTAHVFADELDLMVNGAAQFMASGHFRAAEKQYRAILKQDMAHSQAILGLATALKAQGRGQEAMNLLEDLIARRPDCQPAYYLLGLIYEKQGDMSRARQAYRTYVAIAPHNIPPDPDLRIKLRTLGLF